MSATASSFLNLKMSESYPEIRDARSVQRLSR